MNIKARKRTEPSRKKATASTSPSLSEFSGPQRPWPEPLHWLRGWFQRLDEWAKDGDLPLAHWRGALWPDRHAEDALLALEPRYPRAVRKIRDALENADKLVTEGEVTAESLAEWTNSLDHSPSNDEAAAADFLSRARAPEARAVGEWIELVHTQLRRTIQAIEAEMNDRIQLSDRGLSFLRQLHEAHAFDSDHRQNLAAVVKAIDPQNDPTGWGDVPPALRGHRLIDSKEGRGGGYWLTEDGKRRAASNNP